MSLRCLEAFKFEEIILWRSFHGNLVQPSEGDGIVTHNACVTGIRHGILLLGIKRLV